MKANYINIDGVKGIHVEFKNGFIMNIPVDFDNGENLTEILVDLFCAEDFMTDEWDMGKSLTSDYFTEMRDDISVDYLLDCYSNNDII